ncbi:MAG: outer membrane lipoprotein-sorting protein [Candidatus Marinimicrobia bacterium]|jgi:hypothetical protein|nr:outer membrane lipoprotein-sorting protein [Candidatus Neomarinimicrobiota bacterium]
MKYLFVMMIPMIVFSQSGHEIAEMIDQRPSPKDLTNETEMILTNSKGKVRTHRMISKSMDGNRKQIIWFIEPKDDRGISFLKIEHEDKDDEMRMWLPAFKRVRRISATKRGDSFMGSDLSYEDLSSRELVKNDYTRLDDDQWSGKECYVLETIPKKEARSSYKRHVSWVDKVSMTILKEQSFNRRGNLEKEKEFSYEKRGEYQLIKRVYVKDVIDDHSTEVIFSDLVTDSGLNENLFHEKSLRRIPVE